MKISLKTKIYLALFGFFLVALFLILFFIWPLEKAIKKNSEKLIALKENLVALQEDLKNIQELKKTEGKIKKTKEKIETLFIDKEVPVKFIHFLEALSQNYQLSLELFPIIQKKSQNEPWEPLNFQVNVTGPFPNVVRFLEKIETGPFLVRVEALDISLMEKESELGKVKAIFLLKVYGK